MIRLIIADDHPLVREGVKKVFETSKKLNVSVSAEASDAKELFEILEKQHPPDVILLDINMPGKNGLDILKDLQQKYHQIPVLMLSMHPAERFAVRSLKAGASGYITKESIPDQIEKAVDMVVNKKKKYISEEVAEKLAEAVDEKSGHLRHMELSDREYQVMMMIAEGKKTKEIADELSLSVRTVLTYRKRMMEKLKLDTNVEIANYAIRHHLVENT